MSPEPSSAAWLLRFARLLTLAGLFHQPQAPAPLHVIESADDLFSIENGQ
jgi:hypothetical protein